MKKTLWVFGLITMLSLMVGSSVWADFIGPNYIGTNAKLTIHLKSAKLQNNGNFVLKPTNVSTNGTLVLGTSDGSDLLAPLTEPTPDGLADCYLAFFTGLDPLAEGYFSFCMTEVAFALSENSSAANNNKKHNEKASIFGTGLFFVNDTIINPSGIDGPISIICDVITVKDSDTDLTTEIRTGSCKFQGGLPDVSLTPSIGQRFTFTGTTNNVILIPPLM
jgi:hypothetical protein